MYPAVLQLRGKILKFCQPGKNLLADADELIQPGAQVLHIGSIDPAIFIGYFGVLVYIVAAHLQKIWLMRVLSRLRTKMRFVKKFIETSPF